MAGADWAAKRQRKKGVGFYIGEKKGLLITKVGMGPTISVLSHAQLWASCNS